MSLTTTLEGTKALWTALERCSDPEAIYAAALERLRAAGFDVEMDDRRGQDLDGVNLVVTHTDVGEWTSSAHDLERLVSAEPYLVRGRPMFLPLYARGPYANVLSWSGLLETSRLIQFERAARLDGAVRLTRPRTSEGYRARDVTIEPLTLDPDYVLRLGARPLRAPERVSMPELLLVARRSDLAAARQYVLFPEQADIVFFAKNLLLSSSGMHEPWTSTALELAVLRGQAFSLMLIDRAAGERWEAAAALPTNVVRTFGFQTDILVIAAAADAVDDLVVHGDQMREHFSRPDIAVVDAIADPDETPDALYRRVRAMLGR